MTREQFITESLVRAELRRTPVRSGVLGVLFGSKTPMGAVEILGMLPPHTDAVTVYRTLNTLVKKSLVHRIRGDDGIWRYAVEDPKQSHVHRHPHFVCDECGRVECLKKVEIPLGFSGMRVGKGYSVSYSEVVLHGWCPKCSVKMR